MTVTPMARCVRLVLFGDSELISCHTGYNCGKYGYVNSAGFTPGMKLHCDKGGRVRNHAGSLHACVEYD